MIRQPTSAPPAGDAEREAAERLAIEALGFLARDEELMTRFLAMSGIEAAAIRRAAREPGFLAGVLQFIAAHEPTLLRFCEDIDTPPQRVTRALEALPHGRRNDESWSA